MGNMDTNLTSEVAKGYYRISYRCNNCGTIFEEDIRKGKSAANSNSICTYCGTRSSKITGYFEVIKHNNQLD